MMDKLGKLAMFKSQTDKNNTFNTDEGVWKN
jgi:hypothetical protein